jgi:hypothetical protein
VKVYLRAAGRLRSALTPDAGSHTCCVEFEGDKSLREILTEVDVPCSSVAFALANGKLARLDYRPSDGDVITLQPPLSRA